MKAVTFLVVLFLFAGCTTNGYICGGLLSVGDCVDSSRIDDRTFVINASGTSIEDEKDIREIAYLKAAEVTLVAGFSHFLVVDIADTSEFEPGQHIDSHYPGWQLTIFAFTPPEQPVVAPNTFDASTVVQNLAPTHNPSLLALVQ